MESKGVIEVKSHPYKLGTILGTLLVITIASLWMVMPQAQAMSNREASAQEQFALPPQHSGDDADHDAMHDACLRGDTDAMRRSMDRVHPGWRDHMGSAGGMHSSSGQSAGMMDGGMMGGTGSGGGMMGGGMSGRGRMGSSVARWR